MKRDKNYYEKKIFELRQKLRNLSIQAQELKNPVGIDFFQTQKELAKVWKNYQAWCIRNGETFPEDLYYAD